MRLAAAEPDEHCTVVVPVYNEAPRIEEVVARIRQATSDHDERYSILILNDGSTDWTPELEQRLCAAGPVEVLSFQPNRGKGAMLDAAFRQVDSELAVVIDADGEYAPEEIPALVEPLRRRVADWVVGARYGFGRDRPRQYVATYLVNRLVNWMFQALSRRRTRDLLTGLYGFRTKLVRGLRLRERRFAYTPELMCKVLSDEKVRLLDVPASYRFRSYSEGKKIRWWETATILLAIVRYSLWTDGNGR